jgi:two-component system, OmpR family, response regulator CpxR
LIGAGVGKQGTKVQYSRGGTVKAFNRAYHADAFLPKGACSPVEMLERIRVMVARKRSPRKGDGLRPLVAECPPETIDSLAVGV